MAKYVQEFQVRQQEGPFKGQNFPVDMLRYDTCWPATAEDSANIGDWPESLVITLRRYVDRMDRKPTSARWASFGWLVDDSSIKTRKL